MKVELASGAVMVGGFCVVLVVALALVRTLGTNLAGLLAVGGPPARNPVALGWAYLRS